MRILSCHWRLLVMSAAILAAVTGLSAGFGRRGDPSSSARAGAASEEKSKYVGARFCKNCHIPRQPEDRDTDYVLLTEYNTWFEKDKHSKAYTALTLPRSQQMEKILGYPVAEDERCLNCHAANVSKELRRSDFNIHDGVSCDACHGPASRWILDHAELKWRTTPNAEKQKLGMRNVRDPVELARLCTSCHVGSVAEGKVVTHEMYAAGHPPLPSIEVATFCDQMPVHWRFLRQKKPSIQQLIRDTYKIPAEEEERTKISLIGAVVTFQASMELLCDPPNGEAKKERTDRLPELANYDCYACHHELKTLSWRQKRGYDGPPGRPTMHLWPRILLQDAIRYANDPDLSKQYEEGMQKLRHAFGARPFGDLEQIDVCARQLREWADRLLQRLNKVPYDSPSARRLVRSMCAAKDAQKYDYDSARQKAWAISVILKEVDPKPAERVQKGLDDLRQQLKLDLPSGTQKEILPALTANLRVMNEYDPEKFKAVLDKLGQALPSE